ncbi:MAG: NAD-dependent epimerase/dehydratase family protein [Jatrophihabitans sp.]
MKILVTGAAGLVGTAVSDMLRDRGEDVIGVDRSPCPVGWVGSWAQADLVSEPLDSLVGASDWVVHLAAVPSPGGIPDDLLFANNVTATFRVLDAAARTGVRRAVIASSVSIYGLVWADRELSPSVLPLSESDDLHIEDAYALSKQADENTARMISRRAELPIIALRFPNVSSREDILQRSHRVELDLGYAHRELWAYLDLADAGRAVHAALSAETTGFLAINAVNEQPLAKVNLSHAIERFYPHADRSRLRSNCGYDTDRARTLLKFIAGPIL